jgi:putative serine protease PepD
MEDRPPEFPPTPENPWGAPPPAPPPTPFPPTSAYGTAPGWASQPPLPPPPPPMAPIRPPRADRGVGALLAVAMAAGLIGGGIGAAVTYGVTDNNSTPAVSSLTSKPVTGTKTSSIAPAGSVEQVAAKVLPSVVSIDVRGTAPSQGLMDLGGSGDQIVGSGSGVVISTDGLILTNNHVAESGDLSVTFKDGRTVKAKLIKADKSSDLAVIKAAGISDAIPIAFGSSADLVVGQQVVAVGSPLGLSGTVTSGIVSARERPVVTTQGSGSGGGGDGSVIDAIQTDAPINPGNSGGALVDMAGRLVGITSAIASLGSSLGGQSGSIGLGFAIPIDQARVIAAKLEKGETIAHPLLGVQVTGSPRATQRGALIDQVSAGGAAEKAGLKKGDLIIQLDERLIDTSDALVAGVRSKQPGDKVTVTYLRGNDTRKADVILGSDANVTSS